MPSHRIVQMGSTTTKESMTRSFTQVTFHCHFLYLAWTRSNLKGGELSIIFNMTSIIAPAARNFILHDWAETTPIYYFRTSCKRSIRLVTTRQAEFTVASSTKNFNIKLMRGPHCLELWFSSALETNFLRMEKSCHRRINYLGRKFLMNEKPSRPANERLWVRTLQAPPKIFHVFFINQKFPSESTL